MESVPTSKEIISVCQKGSEAGASPFVPDKVQLGSLLWVPVNQNSNWHKLQGKGDSLPEFPRVFISMPLEGHPLIHAHTHNTNPHKYYLLSLGHH